jgi:hypothetical protein
MSLTLNVAEFAETTLGGESNHALSAILAAPLPDGSGARAGPVEPDLHYVDGTVSFYFDHTT